MQSFERVFEGRRVLVTGHTGFKGGWLALWLKELGAEVHGIALGPQGTPCLFEALGLDQHLQHNVIDIRDRGSVIERIRAIDPEIMFHLAAQPLVRYSYDHPLETIETNVLGTANVLEACRQSPGTKAIVCVTTDKVYQNREWVWPYRETDALGGKDPYSASKAATEIIASCYAQSFFAERSEGPALATARGGNVIGGGDWSQDRLIPDLVRAITGGGQMTIRNPEAVRPWQHVLALCHGYLQLAAGLLEHPDEHRGAWNFGPDAGGTIAVQALLQQFEQAWTLPKIASEPDHDKPETRLLALDSSKARSGLGWRPAWTLGDSVEKTARWYRDYLEAPSQALSLTLEQIHAYRNAMALEQEDL